MSPARTRTSRALYYARQAEGFYEAASGAELRTRGVLAYYGMLNLVKCFLSLRGVELETVKEHHGLSVPLADPTRVEIVRAASLRNVNIFHEFAAQLGTPVTGTHDLTFLEIAHRIPELHGILQGTGLLDGRPCFLPVDIDLLLSPAFDKYFEEIAYDKKHQSELRTTRFLSGKRQAYFKDGVEDGHRIRHQAKRTQPFSREDCPRVYRNSLKRLNNFDIASILTRQGYRYYIDLNAGHYNQLCYTLLLLFYIGSIERYRPTVVDDHFFGRQRPLLSEALALCPNQFLYQVVSLVTGDLCVRPFASLE